MNWLLPAVGLFIILSAWDGHHKGFIRKIVGVLSLALTLIITSVVSPYLHVFLKESTGLYGFLQNSIEGSDMELLDALRVLGMENAVSGYLADEILRWAAFLIALLLAGVLIRGIVFSLGIVSHLPILHGLNKTAGLLLGFAEGVVLVWIFFVVITVCASTSVGGQLLKMTAQSSILSWLYRNNLLLNWLSL
ncbi:CvpA family protein [Laedolimicola intestinihominis]|uniref:CvpA family protein n=1 Tax=Laedolimicola intestinihominis TaxID=3133166 RepID=A0ABV1FLX7_9FIRM